MIFDCSIHSLEFFVSLSLFSAAIQQHTSINVYAKDGKWMVKKLKQFRAIKARKKRWKTIFSGRQGGVVGRGCFICAFRNGSSDFIDIHTLFNVTVSYFWLHMYAVNSCQGLAILLDVMKMKCLKPKTPKAQNSSGKIFMSLSRKFSSLYSPKKRSEHFSMRRAVGGWCWSEWNLLCTAEIHHSYSFAINYIMWL